MTKGYKILFSFVIAVLVLVVFLGMIIIPSFYVNGIFLWAHPLKTAEEGQIKVACVGDSITYGHGVKNWTENAYPFVLNDLLGDEYCVNNYGYSDRTLLNEGNKPYRNEKLYEKSKAFNPDIVVIMLGTNDTKEGNWLGKEKFIEEYVELINSYKELPSNPEIYIMAPPWTIDKAQLRNDIVKYDVHDGAYEAAQITSSTFIDLYPVFGGDDAQCSGLYYMDYIHPNDKGAAVIAKTVYDVLLA